MSGRVDKEFRHFLKAAARTPGWRIKRNKNDPHVKLIAPCGKVILLPTSSRGGKAVVQKRADLRRLGLNV